MVVVSAPSESLDPKKRKKRIKPRAARKPVINKSRLQADLLKKAQSADRSGRLEEAQRFFQLVLKLNPASTEAKKRLEKISAEMK